MKENSDENKKAKGTKKCIIKTPLKFQDYKNCLNAAKIDEELKYLEKKKYNVDKLKKFAEYKTILKTQQRFKSERHDVFIKVINKIALSTNDYKRLQSIDSIETYAYGTREDIMQVKEKIKHYNIVRRCLTLTKSQKNT